LQAPVSLTFTTPWSDTSTSSTLPPSASSEGLISSNAISTCSFNIFALLSDLAPQRGDFRACRRDINVAKIRREVKRTGETRVPARSLPRQAAAHLISLLRTL